MRSLICNVFYLMKKNQDKEEVVYRFLREIEKFVNGGFVGM